MFSWDHIRQIPPRFARLKRHGLSEKAGSTMFTMDVTTSITKEGPDRFRPVPDDPFALYNLAVLDLQMAHKLQ